MKPWHFVILCSTLCLQWGSLFNELTMLAFFTLELSLGNVKFYMMYRHVFKSRIPTEAYINMQTKYYMYTKKILKYVMMDTYR